MPATKSHVRDALRRQQGGEDAWIRLQGEAYGLSIREASPFPGVQEFFSRCARDGISVRIISHKTRRPFQGPAYDLHEAARLWLEAHGFYSPAGGGLLPDHVHFELTKQEKLDRIAQAGCGYFIDDLPEFLAEPQFPAGVKRILFDPHDRYGAEKRFLRVASWMEVDDVIGRAMKPMVAR